jgi:hypothetical protein
MAAMVVLLVRLQRSQELVAESSESSTGGQAVAAGSR